MVGLSSDEKKPPFSGWLRPHRAWGCPCGRGNKKARRSGHHLCNEKEISSETMRAASRFAAHGCGPQALACLHASVAGQVRTGWRRAVPPETQVQHERQ